MAIRIYEIPKIILIPTLESGGDFSNDESWTVEVSSITWGSNYSTC